MHMRGSIFEGAHQNGCGFFLAFHSATTKERVPEKRKEKGEPHHQKPTSLVPNLRPGINLETFLRVFHFVGGFGGKPRGKPLVLGSPKKDAHPNTWLPTVVACLDWFKRKPKGTPSS